MEKPGYDLTPDYQLAAADCDAAAADIDEASRWVLAAYEAADRNMLTICLEIADSEEGEAYTRQLRLAAEGQQQTPPGIYAMEVVQTHFSATSEQIYTRAEILAAEGLRDTIAKRRQVLARQESDRAAEAQRSLGRAFWDGFRSIFDWTGGAGWGFGRRDKRP